MESASVIVIVLMVGLWAAYLAPHAMRRRLAARDTRIEDRYSQDLRILAVVNDTARHTTGGSPSGDVPSHSMSRAIHARSALELEGAGMGSPTPVDPARTAMLARRAAAARRRGVLVAVLLSVTVFTAVLGAVSPVPWWGALIPASLCVTVMVLGRRAVVAQQRADRAWERRNSERSRPTGQTRRREQTPTEAKLAARSAQHNSARRHNHEDVSTSVLSPAEVAYVASTHRTGTPVSADVRPSRSATSPAHAGSAPMHEDEGAAVAHRSSEQPSQHQHHATNATDQPADSDGPKRDNAQQGTPWQAVPVPPPVYTMKAAAPTWEPPSITQELQALTAARLAAIAADSANEIDPDEAAVREAHVVAVHDDERPDSLGVDLNSILARRRAV